MEIPQSCTKPSIHSPGFVVFYCGLVLVEFTHIAQGHWGNHMQPWGMWVGKKIIWIARSWWYNRTEKYNTIERSKENKRTEKNNTTELGKENNNNNNNNDMMMIIITIIIIITIMIIIIMTMIIIKIMTDYNKNNNNKTTKIIIIIITTTTTIIIIIMMIIIIIIRMFPYFCPKRLINVDNGGRFTFVFIVCLNAPDLVSVFCSQLKQFSFTNTK